MILHFEENIVGRDFVIGDIHGCYARFMSMLGLIDFDKSKDRMFSVGDLIDRGPESQNAFSLIYEPWFHSVRGNHEEILSIVQADPTTRHWDWWVQNGGGWALQLAKSELKAMAEDIRKMPLAISVGSGASRFNVIHAEFFGDDKLLDEGGYADHVHERLMWGRQLIKMNADDASRVSLMSATYCGHTILNQPAQVGSQRFIDTGAFKAVFWDGEECDYGLTIVEPKTGAVWRK